jgi:uncharacterized protein involved in outer membrane biogenesis
MARMRKSLKVTLIVIIALVVVLGATVSILVKYSNQIIKAELEKRLGKEFSIEKIDVKWGHVEAIGVALKNPSGKEVIKVGNLSASADFMGLIRGQYVVSSLIIKDPYLFVEVDNKGNIVNPVLPKELTEEKPATKENKPEKPAPPVTIRKIEVTNGSIDYLDRKTPVPPVLTKIRTVDFTISDVSTPFADVFSDYSLKATIAGNKQTGSIVSKGKIKLKTKDMDIKADVHDLDITTFKPYFQKQSPVDIANGLLNLTLDAKVTSQKLNAPGTVVLKNLDFQSGPGAKAKFLGVPITLVVALLKKGDNVIEVKFVITGDLNNPKFDLKESIIDKLSLGIADKLGFSLKGITESVIGTGARGAGDVGTAVKGAGETLKGLFKKK